MRPWVGRQGVISCVFVIKHEKSPQLVHDGLGFVIERKQSTPCVFAVHLHDSFQGVFYFFDGLWVNDPFLGNKELFSNSNAFVQDGLELVDSFLHVQLFGYFHTQHHTECEIPPVSGSAFVEPERIQAVLWDCCKIFLLLSSEAPAYRIELSCSLLELD
jgi:hypothetical protein